MILNCLRRLLPRKLHKHLQPPIHLDQVGFIPTREACNNTPKVLNLIHTIQESQTPCVLIGTDAEKAVDRVNWRFMFAVLHRIGLGEHMLQWITKLYSNPTAQVKANGILLDPFPIYNGTRQGCPLSPLLFALSLEPFLCAIQLNPDNSGVQVGNRQHKISAYADDLLYSLTNPSVSLPNFVHEFDTHGKLSNLQIGKSEAMGVGVPPCAPQNLTAKL